MINKTTNPQVLFIGGPTAVGKTALSIILAQKFNGEVVNGDAYQIYRGMDIGTAKATVAERQGVVHHLLDILDPTEKFSAAQFQRRAKAAISGIHQRGHLPIVVGGTGFYLNALRQNLPLGEAPPSLYRKELQAKLAQQGQDFMWQQLNAIDPASAAKIPPANSRRVIRALEVYHETGTLFSQQKPPVSDLDSLVIGLNTQRALLYQRINQRVDLMLKQGLLDEVQHLLKTVPADAQSMQAIGYKELIPYFAGETTLAAATAAIQQNSRHFAKRQLTYFNNQMPTHWFDLVQHPDAIAQVSALVQSWYRE